MKNKFYYIPEFNKIVYCLMETKHNLIMGGLCRYMEDARNSIHRQQIWKKIFEKTKAIELDETNLSQYDFMELHLLEGKGQWRVIHDSLFEHKIYLKTAVALSTNKTYA